ncbi:MAG: hypothetical protein HKN14_01810 [Marinicaulis sp.]|nr:hypothetical protein [Marinicaulis sp.]
MKHLYGEVANGGFGPHGGLAPLVKIVEKFKRLTAEPQGENGEAWPAHLLPIVLSDPGLDAYDLTSGKIIQWNEELLDEGPAHWENSFRTVASSLETRLLDWVKSPRPADKTRDITTNASLEHLRRTLPVLRAMTRDEREAIGVMGNDWEAEMRRAHGIDPNDLTA